MKTIFFNNKKIILTTKVDLETNFKSFLLRRVTAATIIKTLSTSIKEIRLIHNNKEELLPLFFKKFRVVEAGGGKVFNTNGDILFIYRNSKWDLPKGKIEGNETIENTAIREVEEETGVTNLKIIKPLQITYHLFKRHNSYKLKVTHWFEMVTAYTGTLKPEITEDITKVVWLNKTEAAIALQKSYANIKLLF